jgi:Ni/Co efflux regulator RcnB
MKSAPKYVSFLFLSAALCAPAAMVTRAATQDERRPEENRRNDEQRNDEHRNDEHRNQERRNEQRRVYDRSHRDYHNWDDSEDRQYRIYLNRTAPRLPGLPPDESPPAESLLDLAPQSLGW